jgi:hypothetical protein
MLRAVWRLVRSLQSVCSPRQDNIKLALTFRLGTRLSRPPSISERPYVCKNKYNADDNHLEKCYTCEIQTEHVCLWLSVALCESTLITDELNEHLCFRGLAGRGHKNERQKRSQRRKLVQWQPGETSKLKYSCSWTNHSLFEVHSADIDQSAVLSLLFEVKHNCYVFKTLQNAKRTSKTCSARKVYPRTDQRGSKHSPESHESVSHILVKI